MFVPESENASRWSFGNGSSNRGLFEGSIFQQSIFLFMRPITRNPFPRLGHGFICLRIVYYNVMKDKKSFKTKEDQDVTISFSMDEIEEIVPDADMRYSL